MSPYKDPVENHFMKKFLDKIVTGFFVFIFGICWYLSTKYVVKPNNYYIVVYDIFGKESHIDGVRTKFKSQKLALNYVREYKEKFSHYDFSLREEIPIIKRTILYKLKDQR